jgi:hypothetical protein
VNPEPMSGYQDWSTAGRRKHLPGQADVRSFTAGLGRVTAWVVLRAGHGFDEAALIAHVRERLADYKCPKQVFQLSALPRNHVGKIVRSALPDRDVRS